MKKSILILVQVFLFTSFNQSFAQSGMQLTPNGVFDLVSDNHGNTYQLADLLVAHTKIIGSGGNTISTPSITCSSGYFTLYFTGSLFTTGTQSAQTQAINVVCSVFSSI